MQDRSSKTAVRSRAGRRAWAFARRCAAILVLVAIAVVHPGPSGAQTGPVAVLLDVEGAIGPATTEYLRQGFEAAAARDAALIVLRMDTPGGLDSATRDIVQDILASPIPVVTYVAPSGARAASAGTYILYASHLAAMAPGTNLGAATPVQLGGGESGGEDAPADAMTAKIVNDSVAYIRALAELHDRNAEWAEQAVRQAASLSARAALDRQVIEIVAADLDDLLARAQGRTVSMGERQVTLETQGIGIVAMEPDLRVRLLGIITNPNIAFILMLIGVYGIIFEFVSPGAIFPGVIGAIALILGLFALNLLPINYAGAGLVLLGIALMTAEAFVPSFGTLGIGGAIAFAAGALFMFEDVPGLELSLSVVLTATAASAALLAVMLAAVVRAHRREVASGESTMIGSVAEVIAWSGARGQVHIHGERWQARSHGRLPHGPLSPGDRVRVTGREKLFLLVEPETPPEP